MRFHLHRTRPDRDRTCWVISFDRPDAAEEMVPVAVATTCQQAEDLLQRLLSTSPGRNNRIETVPFHAKDGQDVDATSAIRVQVVIAPDEEDGEPLVSEVFDSREGATRHAQELRSYGESNVTVTDMVVNALPVW